MARQIRTSGVVQYAQHVTGARGGEMSDVQLADDIVPVLDVTPGVTRAVSGSLNNSTNAVLYTAPATGEVYLWGAALAGVRDATATNTGVVIQVETFAGETVNFLALPALTLTAAPTTGTSITLPKGLRVRPNGTIQLVATTNVANFFYRGCIFIQELLE